MPQPSSGNNPSGPYRKPRADVYTVLLIIAFLALIVGIVMLYMELDMYEFEHKGGPTLVWNDRPAATAAYDPPAACERWGDATA